MRQVNQFSSFQYAEDDDLIEQEDEDLTFSLYPSFQETYETDLAEDPSIEVVPVVISATPVPLLLRGMRRVNTTGSLAVDSDKMPALSVQRPETTFWPFKLDDLPEPETFTEPLVTTAGQFKVVSGVLPALPTESPVTSTGQFKVISGVLPAVFEQQPEANAGWQQIRNTSALPGDIATQQQGAATGQLEAPTAKLPIFVATPSLAASLQAAINPGTAGRIVVIPGSRKGRQAEKKTTPSGERMNPRLRQGVTLAAALLVVVITSLLTLGHLASGQYPFPVFQSFNSWFQSNAADQQLAAHFNAGQVNARTLPPMHLPHSPYVGIAQQDAIAAGIPADYFVRQINQESGFNPNAVSPAGAEGIAQFMPGTAAGLGINPWDPVQALRAAARLMASYMHNYGGDYAKALAAYNAGNGAVQHATYVCGSSWMNCLPSETRNYIYVIMGI
jgi:soluble lytic murein transglycosylase-like protein